MQGNRDGYTKSGHKTQILIKDINVHFKKDLCSTVMYLITKLLKLSGTISDNAGRSIILYFNFAIGKDWDETRVYIFTC